ncbi:MAG: adenine-specific methyltransferase EcoRI family protein, partial [bacterium]|nr:adenine-specific methyltransferase EcoRI family protein [bacterium]
MANNNLANAKRAKNDEFYTQYGDIQKEIEAYLEYNPDVFRDKVVYCNCDDPFESNFFRYFVLNFNKLRLKRLITTSYKPSPIANMELPLIFHEKKSENKTQSKGRPKVTANKFIINEVHDIDGDGEFNLKDIAKQLKANKHNEWTPLEKDGDFRSPECVELLEQSDIVVTNPPFSLFREYLKQLMEYEKKFVIIGNMNAITYKEIFPLLKDNKMWLGAGKNDGRNVWYQVPDSYKIFHKEEDGKKYAFVAGTVWFTNLDHGRRHHPLPLMTEKEIIKFVTKKPFEKYDNYDAIEVSVVKNIPRDYRGVMGVPISFLSKYNPEQFKILGLSR